MILLEKFYERNQMIYYNFPIIIFSIKIKEKNIKYKVNIILSESHSQKSMKKSPTIKLLIRQEMLLQNLTNNQIVNNQSNHNKVFLLFLNIKLIYL